MKRTMTSLTIVTSIVFTASTPAHSRDAYVGLINNSSGASIALFSEPVEAYITPLQVCGMTFYGEAGQVARIRQNGGKILASSGPPICEF